MLMIVAMSKFLPPFFTSSKSLVAIPRPIPIIGPMSGEINIAPIITAVEFTLSPTDAIMIAKISVQSGPPTKMEFLEIESTTSLSLALSMCKLKRFAMKIFIAPRISSLLFSILY